MASPLISSLVLVLHPKVNASWYRPLLGNFCSLRGYTNHYDIHIKYFTLLYDMHTSIGLKKCFLNFFKKIRLSLE